MKFKKLSHIAGLLSALFLCGCKSSLSVPLVDISTDSRPNVTVEGERNKKLENRVRDLERENKELRKRLEKLEDSLGAETQKNR